MTHQIMSVFMSIAIHCGGTAHHMHHVEPTHAQLTITFHVNRHPLYITHTYVSVVTLLPVSHGARTAGFLYISQLCVCPGCCTRAVCCTLTPLFPLTRISHSAFGVAGSTCLLGR